ncbi:MAG: hypothetical protein HKP58_07840 [Desulfatitalea sp.]|nr:hypothetical protein [Desulfatitalea sp.]NNK00311.1 hypothetical protein [Desulfatitalea sp.]
MKRTILLFLFFGCLIAFSAQAEADYHDNLTIKQAEAVVAYPSMNICSGATRFPNPAGNEIADQDYANWFAEKGLK